MAPSLRRLALLGSLALLGCSSASPEPVKAPPAPARAASPASIIDWAFGPQQLTPTPTVHDRGLLRLAPRQPVAGGQRVQQKCLAASGFLPAPAADGRIFFLVGGQVLASPTPGAEPELLDNNDPALGVSRLLAFDKSASPLEMLVAARPHGAPSEQIWKLVLEPRAIHAAAQVTLDLADKEAFFARFNAPRCLDGGHRCLSPSADTQQSFIDEQLTRDSAPETLQSTGAIRVFDASWAAGDGSAMYLLVPCVSGP